MKQNYLKRFASLKSIGILTGMLLVGSFAAEAQTPTNVDTDHIDNNGNSLITFNVQNTNPFAINLTEFRCNTNTAGSAVTVLYNPTPSTNAGSWTAGVIGAGQNGWVLVGNGTATASNAVGPVLQGMNLLSIPPNTTYQFCISTGMGYMTLTGGINTFSGGGVNILTGDGISWGGGAIPATPANYPRGFVGGISFVPGAPPLAIDAGITEFVTPTLPTCNFSGPVSVIITNFGSDTLTSAQANWEWNTVPQTPVTWTGSLAQFETDTIVLGTVALASGSDLVAYTSNPNMVLEDPAGAINDSSSLLNLQAGLAGIYTIGGTAPDYADVNAAINDLTTFGICSAVTFDIRDGVYSGQLDLPSLATSSPMNTVTFRSENGDAALVTLDYQTAGTGDNYVVNMQNVNNFHFENLTIQNTGTGTSARVIQMTGSSMNSFVGCHLLGTTTSNTTSTNACVIYSNSGIDSNNLFLNNTIEGGSYGAYWYGAGTTSLEKNNVFEGNHFVSNYFYGMRVQNNEGTILKNNTIDGFSAYNFTRYGIYMFNVFGSPEVTGNVVKGEGTSGFYYGIYMINGGGTNANHALVANNMLSVGKVGNTNSTMYGIYYSNVGYVDTYHNTSLVFQAGTNSRAFYATGGGGNTLMNNIFSNETGGYALYVNSAFSVTNSDYNVLYAPGGNAGYFGSAQATLADWQNASTFDANSIDYNPNFYSNTDLHVCSDSIGNQGTSIASITMDVDGQMRDAVTPDMGADEFSGLSGSFLGNDVVVCTGDSVQLSAGSPSDDILWSTGDTTAFIWVSTPGSFTVSVTGACGAGTDAIVVTQSAVNYTGYLEASDLEFCNGSSVTLYSTQAADTYSWTGGSSNDSLVITTGGTYTLDIADGCGTGSEAVTITMNDVPATSFTNASNNLTGIFTNTTTGAGASATYAWNFGDGQTSSLQDPLHVYGSSGAFYVTLTVTNDCGSMMFGDTIFLSAIGLEEIADFGSVNVAPNPSNGLFNVNLELNQAMNLQLVVTNVMGQVVSTKTIDAATGTESTQIDLSTAAAGVYYLDILSGDRKMINKVLIKK